MRNTLLLLALLACHYLADFCLTTSKMIQAKADGKNIWPILLHAGVHALLVGVCLLFFGVSLKLMLLLILAEHVTHFLVDTGKGCITARFPKLADMRQKPYWMLYGFDQLLHQLVIVGIWYYAIIN